MLSDVIATSSGDANDAGGACVVYPGGGAAWSITTGHFDPVLTLYSPYIDPMLTLYSGRGAARHRDGLFACSAQQAHPGGDARRGVPSALQPPLYRHCIVTVSAPRLLYRHSPLLLCCLLQDLSPNTSASPSYIDFNVTFGMYVVNDGQAVAP